MKIIYDIYNCVSRYYNIKIDNPRDLFDFGGLIKFTLAVRRGLEPLTPCVTGTYSNQLN